MSFAMKRDDSLSIVAPQSQPLMSVYNDGTVQIGDAVTLRTDGSVKFGPGYTTTDEAARQFWEALALLRPDWARAKDESEL